MICDNGNGNSCPSMSKKDHLVKNIDEKFLEKLIMLKNIFIKYKIRKYYTTVNLFEWKETDLKIDSIVETLLS